MPTPLANGPRHLRKAVRGRGLLSSREVPPRAERGSAGRIEGGGAGVAIASRHRPIELELEGGAAICVGPLRVVAEPEQLSELPAPAGVCAETPQAATAQGGSGAAGSLRGRVGGADGGGPTDWGQDIFRRRGPLSGGWGSAGQVGVAGGTVPGGLHQSAPGREGTSPRT